MDASVDNKSCKTTIREGKAVMSLSTDKVFYNPVQEFNRDLSIAVLSVFTSEYTEEKIAKAQLKSDKRTKEEKLLNSEAEDDVDVVSWILFINNLITNPQVIRFPSL